MIETMSAVDALPDILAVEGISGVYVGPADLSMTMIGQPTGEPSDPDVVATVDWIRSTVQKSGGFAAVHNLTTAHAAEMAANGWNMVTGPSDISLIADASTKALMAMKAS